MIRIFILSIFISTSAFAQQVWNPQGQKKTYRTHNGKEIYLPSGKISFADRVVSSNYGKEIPRGKYLKVAKAEKSLGEPNWVSENYESTCMGCGGQLVLEFTDNRLVDIPGIDLYIFEIGPAVEPTSVYVGNVLGEWIYVGKTKGSTSGLDISRAVKPTDSFRYIKLVDLESGCGGKSPGADIDAVAAIGSISASQSQEDEPENDSFDQLEIGESMVLESILFYRNSTRLYEKSFEQINQVAAYLKKNNHSIEISGHTESRGGKKANLRLSQRRAEKVKELLVNKGIRKKRIVAKGYGGQYPIASNDREETRRLNRRVELKVID